MDLFDDLPPEGALTHIAPGAVLLHGFARDGDAALLQAIESVLSQAPLRHWQTPGGYTMSVAMSNCGPLGWVSSASGYRYAALDPASNQPWPAMPACLLDLAQRAAARAGYATFQPDACLINEYVPGAKLSTCARPSSRSPWVCPRCFCSAPPAAKTVPGAGGWCMATWWCGAARHDWPTTA
jgi:alkylated DNA repair protein (DNA oxidative demethylase)